MNEHTPAGRALNAATLSLLAALGGIAMFLPPLNQHVLGNPLAMVGAGLVIACSLALHLVFVALLSRRLGRGSGWVWAALLLFPVGSIVGLVLLHWQHAVDQPAPGHG